MIVIIILYAVGIPVSYILFKIYMGGFKYGWTKGGRRRAIFPALWSWVGVITSLVCMIIDAISEWADSDKPAKW